MKRSMLQCWLLLNAVYIHEYSLIIDELFTDADALQVIKAAFTKIINNFSASWHLIHLFDPVWDD